ncbi:lysyl-tRNA synthetase [Tulasnella sp. 424]|nr:lysyl-tRNA synthetase [Tulasnella sp. 424]KAG8975504.1 lysyl-tRNA synthetase [Tulasnella sp. 425]
MAQAQDAPSAEEFLSTHSHFRRADTVNDSPEFGIYEFYMAYADVYDLMAMTESLVTGLVQHLTGGTKIMYHPDGKSPRELLLDFQRPWKQYGLIETVEEKSGVKFPPGDQLHTPEASKFLSDLAEKVHFTVSENAPYNCFRFVFRAFETQLSGEFIEPFCVSPAFIVSPISSRSVRAIRRFMCGKEFCNSYTKLNDSFERFEEQMKQKTAGDEEAQEIDETFVNARVPFNSSSLPVYLDNLEHGLPPTGGWGMGIDRLVMFVTDSTNIKEVLLFPATKPETGGPTAPAVVPPTEPAL